MSLRHIARALGGEVSGSEVLAPAPGHSRRDRGLSVRIDPRAPGGILVHLFNPGDPLVAKDYVRERLGLAGCLPDEHSVIGSSSSDDLPTPSDSARTDRALALWQEAQGPRGTPVELYLAHRGLELPQEAAGAAIRWHPACPFRGQRTGAMMALARDVVTDEPKAVHRTALSHDGNKVTIEGKDRLALGPIAGGAVKLTPDADAGLALGIGEGIESTLSLRLAPESGTTPVWSLLSAGGIDRFPVLKGIEALWIAVDHDDAGLRAARACASRWKAAGAEAYLVTPRAPRADLNDLVRVHHA